MGNMFDVDNFMRNFFLPNTPSIGCVALAMGSRAPVTVMVETLSHHHEVGPSMVDLFCSTWCAH